ncbi:MAG: response regulator transcription factor [Lachnospiraceae bacterium]|nr:response regulator transcription factor [Lachnospiraceae bacterium]
MTDILIIEDDEELRGLLTDLLEADDYRVTGVGSAEDGVAFLAKESCRLILLDLMLPGIDGFAACSAIREQRDVPIIMLSARGDDESKLTGYRLGADDFLEKPVSMPILGAKIKALLHRSEAARTGGDILRCGAITVDTASRLVSRNGAPCEIRGKMYDLLLYMMKNQGRLLLKDELYDAVWGDLFVEQSTLNVHVRWLRERLEDEPDSPKIIRTVWRKGYIFGGES